MCCFSGPVEEVSGTKIFARRGDKNTQYLVYSMHFKSLDDLAMILPIPTPTTAAEDAVKFINLKEYANFFGDLEKGFPAPRALTRSAAGAKSEEPASKPLAVVDVGDFEASFVPTIKDFARLDKRFRLPETTWEKLPSYKRYGFAVFKLKKGSFSVHPMAFRFPTALRDAIFFPTIHIHDGAVHAKANFDHSLYCQVPEGVMMLTGWSESPQPAGMFMDRRQAGDLIQPMTHVYRRGLHGMLKNEDTLV